MIQNLLQQAVPQLRQLPQNTPPPVSTYPGPTGAYPRPAPARTAPAATAASDGLSFSCAGPKTPTEGAICGDPELADLDHDLARAYVAAGSATAPANLSAMQRAWLRQRNACRADIACIRAAMVARLAELRGAPQANGPSQDAAPSSGIPTERSAAGTVDCATAKPGLAMTICRDHELSGPNRELASAYAAVADDPGLSPQLAAEQRAWIERRDNRSPGTTRAYARLTGSASRSLPWRPRAGKPAPDGDGVSAESVAAAHRWGVPTRDGLPCLPRVEEVGADARLVGTPASDIMNLMIYGAIGTPGSPAGFRMEHATPAVRGWTRMVYAMGLAASPDAVANLDDASLADFACIFLEPAAQAALTGGKTCDDLTNPTRSAGAEFAVHDLAVGFRTRELPRIIQEAPRLPFRFVVAMTTPLPPYEIAAGRFKLLAGNPEGILVRALGSSSNTVMRDLSWPVPESEARAIVQDKGGDQDREIFLAIPLTITGTMALGRPKHPQFNGANGLPSGTQWRMEGGEITLYGNARLTRRLYAFGRMPRLPLPTEGTAGADAPHPAGPARLDGDTAMLILLHDGKLDPDKVKWNDAGESRYLMEQQLAHRTDRPLPASKRFRGTWSCSAWSRNGRACRAARTCSLR